MFWFKVLYIFFFHNGGAFLFFYFVEWNKRDCNGIGEIFKMYYNLFFNSLFEKMFRITTIRVSFNWV